MPAYGDAYHFLKRQHDEPTCHRNTLTVSAILAFAEGLELANSRRQRVPLITTGLHR
jgi:hypothetical protein